MLFEFQIFLDVVYREIQKFAILLVLNPRLSVNFIRVDDAFEYWIRKLEDGGRSLLDLFRKHYSSDMVPAL